MLPSQKVDDAPDCQSDASSSLSLANASTLPESIKRSNSPPKDSNLKRINVDEVVKTNIGDSPPNLNIDHLEEGEKCEIQTLYEGASKCTCCKNWVEDYPDNLGMNIEQEEEIKQRAIVVRMRKSHSDGKLLELDSVIVQNSSLKQTLSEVFNGYQGITTSLKKLVFEAPFHPFYHQWDQFSDILERQKKEDHPGYLFSQLLYKVLHAEIRGEMDEIKDHTEQGIVTFKFLWALFEPGSLLFSLVDGKERFFIVSSYSYQHGCLALHTRFVDWDGQKFGYNNKLFPIGQFSGTMNITDLPIYPFHFHPSASSVRDRAIERGRKFQELQGTHYKAYSGPLSLALRNGQAIERKIDERVVVDAASYFDHNGCPLRLESLAEDSIKPRLGVTDNSRHRGPPPPSLPSFQSLPPPPPPIVGSYHAMESEREEYLRPPPPPPIVGSYHTMESKQEEYLLRRQQAIQRNINESNQPNEQKEESGKLLNEKQLLLCNSKVKAYPLQTKTWGGIEVDHITNIAWNDDAFANLVLPSGYKSLVTCFVEGQARHTSDFDDIIQGKGLGVVILLVGTPGTGKTLTAETVADNTRKPLYVLSAGELGNEAEEVERRLDKVLRLAEKWNAVLLFDECDVFLQQRSMDHLQHNEIVAVFLRVIEYYRGILILTTNRGNAIDGAFQSRIHLTLHYPDLDATAREKVWRRCTIDNNAETSLSHQALKNLSELPMNGRQIRNVVKISRILAGKEKSRLGLKQIRTVLEATQQNNGMSLDVLGADETQD
ncbi:uncharacterized protein B0J16DRAFT_372781 [Fusarium flagelliforme]|uniref:uncharacterized protein n=1 Tax=Fusarium flagelliforme TaxID=2675880 RepID=UPI001E8D7E41|nr:uncharacterized protein B0J16DRAFT_372781 [Fusarium flagelliforme]KAH7186068.1 hypothetical protein B0J16DRAFT_372781 [Fusarium flagelliforme]